MTVDHSKGEYARTSEATRLWTKPTGRWHSNTAENFFSIFKRGVIGTYHHMSEAHLHPTAASSISATTPAP